MTRRNRATGMVTPITPGNVARRLGSRLATSAMEGVINAVPYGRTAVNAARIIQSAYRGYKARAATKKTQSAPYRKSYQFSGRYVGRFKKPLKGGKISLPKKLGSVLSHEQFGKIDDPDLVCLGHSTWPIHTLTKAISYAILRKAFKKAFSWDCLDVNQEIPANYYNESTYHEVVFIWRDGVSGTITPQIIGFANNDTIATMASKPSGITTSIQEAIFAKFENETTWHTRELERVMVRYTGAPASVKCDMNMLNEVLKLKVSSSVKIQNRTLAATAASADTDRVDSQPVKGKLLKFKGLPKLKNMNVPANQFALFQTVGTTPQLGSVILVRGAELPSGHSEPKVKQDWNNCYASSSVSLQPGEIKSSSLSMYKAAYFNNLFKSVQQTSGNLGAPGLAANGVPGYSQLFFFEEVLNSGSTNKITLNYEQQIYVSAYLVQGKGSSINTQHSQQEQNNLTA